MLLEFPFYKNYLELVQMELNALASVKISGHTLSKFAVIGSGPLPLTSLCVMEFLQNQPGSVSCHNIDQDPQAISSSRNTCKALGYTNMCFQCNGAQDANCNLGFFDVVYLAALVGATSKAKRDIIASVVTRMRPGALLVLRSARKYHTWC